MECLFSQVKESNRNEDMNVANFILREEIKKTKDELSLQIQKV